MATEDAFEAYDTSTDEAILLNSRIRVGTARRMKTTKPLPKNFSHKPMFERKSFLVQANKKKGASLDHTRENNPRARLCQTYY